MLKLKREKTTFITEDNLLKFDKTVSREDRIRLSELMPQGAPFCKYSPKYEVIRPQSIAFTFQTQKDHRAEPLQQVEEEKEVKCNRFRLKAEMLEKNASALTLKMLEAKTSRRQLSADLDSNVVYDS